jgi:hypothetical protein
MKGKRPLAKKTVISWGGPASEFLRNRISSFEKLRQKLPRWGGPASEFLRNRISSFEKPRQKLPRLDPLSF